MHRVIYSFLVLLVMSALCLPASGAQSPAQSPAEPPAPTPSAAVQNLLQETVESAKAGKIQQALDTAERALVAAREAKDIAGEAWAQRTRALLFQDLHRTGDAAAAWREAAALWQRAGDGPGRVEALTRAVFLLTPAELEEAEQLFADALAVGGAEVRRPLAAADALDAAGFSFYQRGNLVQARELWTAALAIRGRLVPNSLDVAVSLNVLGVVTYDQGDLPLAKEYHQHALSIREKLAPDSLLVADSLNNLGCVVREQGDLTGAKEYHQRALSIHEKLAPDSLLVAGSLSNLGNVAGEQGDLTGAKEYHQRALSIHEKLAPDSLLVAVSLNNLGNVAMYQGDLTGAKKHHQRALSIREKLAPDSLDVADSLSNLGNMAMYQGDLTGAKKHHQRALSIQEKLAPDSLLVAGSLNNLGLVARHQGDLTGAKEYHQRALSIQEKLAPDSLDVAGSLNNLGAVAQDQGDLPLAERRSRQAWELVQHHASTVAGGEARQAYGSATASYADNLARVLFLQGKNDQALAIREEGHARALQELIAERQAFLEATGGKQWADLQQTQADLSRTAATLDRASIGEGVARGAVAAAEQSGGAPKALRDAQAVLTAKTEGVRQARATYLRLSGDRNRLWAEVQKSAPRVFARPATLEETQKALPADLLSVSFIAGDESTLVFLLRGGVPATPGGGQDASQRLLSAYRVQLGITQLQTLVQTYRNAVSHRGTELDDALKQGRSLFAALFPGEARHTLLAAKRLLISPDGPLWELPFAALVTNSTGEPAYLGTEKPITYTPSLTLFVQARAQPPHLPPAGRPVAVVVGDPVFDRSQALAQRIAARPEAALPPRERAYLFLGGQPPPRLPATRLEATQIARLYGATSLIGEGATEAALRQRIGKADVIHLATHGYFHPFQAMSSGVLLTVPDKEPAASDRNDDGALQAWEIQSQLHLRAELVVLSACETGRGKNVRGEGIVGLTWALQYAGARSIVASQWQVADASTAALMVSFHQKLREGRAKDRALQEAMAELRRRPATASPYFWAPFFLLGDPDNHTLGSARK